MASKIKTKLKCAKLLMILFPLLPIKCEYHGALAIDKPSGIYRSLITLKHPPRNCVKVGIISLATAITFSSRKLLMEIIYHEFPVSITCVHYTKSHSRLPKQELSSVYESVCLNCASALPSIRLFHAQVALYFT